MLGKSVKQIEFHSFLIMDGRVFSHYRKLYRIDNPLDIPPLLWYDPEHDFEGEEPVDVIGGAMFLNGTEISNATLVSGPNDVPGMLVPSPDSPEWNLTPLNEEVGVSQSSAVEEVHGR